MKKFAAVFIFIGVQSLEGCTYVPGVEPSDLSMLKKETVTRSEVEAAIGQPLESRNNNEGSINVYEYDRGAKGENETVPIEGNDVARCLVEMGPLCILVVPVLQVGIWAATPIMYAVKANEQEGNLVVVYSANDRVVRYRIVPAKGNIDSLIDREVEYSKLKLRADESDPEAMYQYAKGTSERLERMKWYCRAAHADHAQAQYMLANYRWTGKRRPSGKTVPGPDKIAAYVWFTIALEGGVATAKQSRDRLSQKMTPAQVAEAERLVAEWKPNPAECELISGESPTVNSTMANVLWNGKWFDKDGVWSLYLEVEIDAVTGRVLRRGSDSYSVTGTISPNYTVVARIDDEDGAPMGSLSGMFPNVSVYQSGRVQASFKMERRD